MVKSSDVFIWRFLILNMDQEISSLLKPELIELEPVIAFPALPENPDKIEGYQWQCKELIIAKVVEVLSRPESVRNTSKLYRDLLHREKRATTAVGEGLAIPHVRTMQPRDLTVCFLRFKQGVEFMSIDDQPVYFIFAAITPPYEDKKYFNVLAWLGRAFTECFWLKDSLLAAGTPEEIRSIFINVAKEYA